jgi:tetratricopeptide (TPR) repeat protein
MAKYKCPTLGDCDRANAGEIFERAPGEDLTCPGCSLLLEAQTMPSSLTGARKLPVIGAAAAGLFLLAGAGYLYQKRAAAPADLAVTTTAQATPMSTAPVDAPTSAVLGMVPSDAETQALRIQSDAQLARGEAAEAEAASNKAATNEMLKQAIAKMAQGKLDEAEKDLAELEVRSPKHSLVYYNMAILRLRQGRTEDALKEFEASFMAGFSYFDKLDQDSDLDGMRKLPRFVALVAKYRTPAK